MSGELTLDPKIARSFPDGTVDSSTFDDIESALDSLNAPMREGKRWLSLKERIVGYAVQAARRFNRNVFVDLTIGGCDPSEFPNVIDPKNAVQASIRQILNGYFVEQYGLHSLQANALVDDYLAKLISDDERSTY